MKNTRIQILTSAALWCLMLLPVSPAWSLAPPLRTQQPLNGVWRFTPEGGAPTTIEVPSLWDSDKRFGRKVKQATYERRLNIPSGWLRDGRRVKVEFDGVCHSAEVYVGDRLVMSHAGGWIPFSADITDFIEPGRPVPLKVQVKGGGLPPISDDRGYPLFPVGWFGHEGHWGIVFGVHLRSYGAVHIEDSFVQTSFRNKEITVDYQVTNTGDQPREVQVKAVAKPEKGAGAGLTMESPMVSVAPGETKQVTVSKAWEDPHLWNTDDPFLYVLQSSIVDGARTVDTETRRFGFRELWIEGNQYRFNGHRLNLRGDNQNHQKFDQIIENKNPDSYREVIARWKKLNFNFVRYHMEPAPQYVLDIADEEGIFVMWETPVYFRPYILSVDKKRYLENFGKWVGPFVRASRNHASLVMWSACNEMGRNYVRYMSDSEIRWLGDEIKKHDPTRPVSYDGEMDIKAETVNLHYMMMYLARERGDIYNFSKYVHPEKPTGIGELFWGKWEPFERKAFTTGAWVRGLRYVNFAEFRIYTLTWAWNDAARRRDFGLPGATGRRVVLEQDWDKRLTDDPIWRTLKNAYAPIALFDKEYDRRGGDLYWQENWPKLYEGSTVDRTLILYNDDYSGTDVDVEVTIIAEGKTVATGRKTFSVPLGEHFDIPVSFQVPHMDYGRGEAPVESAGRPFDMVLATWKNGVKTFEEIRRFNIRETGHEGDIATEVTIGDAQPPEF